ncbi:MAG: hypothetical protein CMG25_02100 [Candidatus Marinimicrobia bacterium]|nr:hypothetical protein [Candidatus Neomarinimicrobiota bacterium]
MILAGLNLIFISFSFALIFILSNNFILKPMKEKYNLRNRKILEFLIFNSIIIFCFIGSILLTGIIYYLLYLVGF